MTSEQETELFELAPDFADLLPAYSDAKVAFANYANYVSRKHCDAGLSPACECCGGLRPGDIYTIGWRGDYDSRRSRLLTLVSLPLLAIGHISSHYETIRFHTKHRMCVSCRRRLRAASIASELLRHAVFVATILLGAGMAVAFFMMTFPLMLAKRWEWAPFVCFVAFLTVFVFAYRASRRLNGRFLPQHFAAIAKNYFVIEAIRTQR